MVDDVTKTTKTTTAKTSVRTEAIVAQRRRAESKVQLKEQKRLWRRRSSRKDSSCGQFKGGQGGPLSAIGEAIGR